MSTTLDPSGFGRWLDPKQLVHTGLSNSGWTINPFVNGCPHWNNNGTIYTALACSLTQPTTTLAALRIWHTDGTASQWHTFNYLPGSPQLGVTPGKGFDCLQVAILYSDLTIADRFLGQTDSGKQTTFFFPTARTSDVPPDGSSGPQQLTSGCTQLTIDGGDHANQYSLTITGPDGFQYQAPDYAVNAPYGVSTSLYIGDFAYHELDKLTMYLTDKTFSKTWPHTDINHCRVTKDDGTRIVTYAWDDAGGAGVPDADFNDLVVRLRFCARAKPDPPGGAPQQWPDRGALVLTPRNHFLRPRPMQ